MTKRTLITALLIALAAPLCTASQLYLIEARELEQHADVVLVGTVSHVEEDTTIPNDHPTGYDLVTLDVGFVLKGYVTTNTITIRLATRGLRAYNPTLRPHDSAVFFLGLGADGIYGPAYPGAIALFQKGYFREPQKQEANHSIEPTGDTRAGDLD